MDIKLHDQNQITVADNLYGMPVSTTFMLKKLPGDRRKTLLERGELTYMLARDKMDRRFKRVRASRPDTSPTFMLSLIEWFLAAKGLRSQPYEYLCRDVPNRTPEGGFYRLSVYFYGTCLFIDVASTSSATVKHCFKTPEEAIDSYIDFYLGEKNYLDLVKLEHVPLERNSKTAYVSLGHDLSDILKVSLINEALLEKEGKDEDQDKG